MTTFAVVTGGGTSGHVLPALAVAEALVAAGHPQAEVHYVGTERGVETRLVPPTGFPYTFLDVAGLHAGNRGAAWGRFYNARVAWPPPGREAANAYNRRALCPDMAQGLAPLREF